MDELLFLILKLIFKGLSNGNSGRARVVSTNPQILAAPPVKPVAPARSVKPASPIAPPRRAAAVAPVRPVKPLTQVAENAPDQRARPAAKPDMVAALLLTELLDPPVSLREGSRF